MKSLIAIVASAFALTAFAAEPAKTEAVKKPEATASAPATPKEMPKVEKPAKKVDATKSAAPAKAEDKKAEAAKK